MSKNVEIKRKEATFFTFLQSEKVFFSFCLLMKRKKKKKFPLARKKTKPFVDRKKSEILKYSCHQDLTRKDSTLKSYDTFLGMSQQCCNHSYERKVAGVMDMVLLQIIFFPPPLPTHQLGMVWNFNGKFKKKNPQLLYGIH